MQKKVTLEYCDKHGFDEKKPANNIATRHCIFCEKAYCSHPDHQADNYSTFQHFKNKPDIGFICAPCWEAIRSSRKYEKLRRLVDKHASGSTFAIYIAEYYDGMVAVMQKIADRKLGEFLKSSFDERKAMAELNIRRKEIEEEAQRKLDEFGI